MYPPLPPPPLTCAPGSRVHIFHYFHLYLQKSINKKKAAEPQGQALTIRSCSGAIQTKTQTEQMLVKKGAHCKFEPGGHFRKVEEQ